MKQIEIYTDGGCSGNPGPGGWAYILKDGDNLSKKSGGEPETTNNRMELTAVIRALEYVAESPDLRERRVELHTDSQYVKNGITQWIHTWLKNGWVTSGKQPVKNQDLWKELKGLQDILQVTWYWVKGHAGHIYNEQADALVGGEIDLFRR